jgi:hypothetical protein
VPLGLCLEDGEDEILFLHPPRSFDPELLRETRKPRDGHVREIVDVELGEGDLFLLIRLLSHLFDYRHLPVPVRRLRFLFRGNVEGGFGLLIDLDIALGVIIGFVVFHGGLLFSGDAPACVSAPRVAAFLVLHIYSLAFKEDIVQTIKD